MGSNQTIKYVAVFVGIMVLLITLKTCTGSADTIEPVQNDVIVGGGEALSDSALEGLGIEGDTEKDVVSHLVGMVRELKAASAKMEEQIKNQEYATGSSDSAAVEAAIKRFNEESDRKIQGLERQLTQLNLRLSRSDEAQGTPQTSEETVWVQPLGGMSSSTVASVLNKAGGSLMGLDQLQTFGGKTEQTITPYYTIPKNATLTEATALTALIGRVPVGASVSDPYSFKVIIGRDNLAANGIEIPEVAHAIISGKAVGDWTLGCVRGDVYSMTFVFEDGTIRTVPEAKDIYQGGASSQEVKIGELSDSFGNPCVMGERVSNAYSYLAQRIGIVGIGAAAEAAATSQTTLSTSSGAAGFGAASSVTGSMGDYILGRTIADGTREVADWMDRRQSQQFDVIYVAPGRAVSLHITEQITIDYDSTGRKTNHTSQLAGGYRELD